MKNEQKTAKPYDNPYIAGLLLGLVLLVSFVVLGAGLGASGGMARIAAFIENTVFPAHTQSGEYFGKWGSNPLSYYLVYMLIGVFCGGLVSAVMNRRAAIMIEKGTAASPRFRLALALVGGVLVGFASRLAGGCTSGQALTGGALMLTGSIAFLICMFVGGFATAWLVRRQWND